MVFVHGIVLVHQFRTGIFGTFLWLLSQNPKNNCIFHNHDHTKNRFLRQCSKNGMNVGVMRVVDHYYQSTNESLRLAILNRTVSYAHAASQQVGHACFKRHRLLLLTE